METELQLSTETLALFQTDKHARKLFVNDLIERLNSGEIEPLEIHLQIKAMEDIITQLTSTDEKKNKNFTAAIRYKQLLLQAAELHGKTFTLHNSKFEIKEAGTTYDYSGCGDPEYNEMIKERADLDFRIKEREAFLKTMPSCGLIVTNKETGETVTVYPPIKKSTTTVAVTLK